MLGWWLMLFRVFQRPPRVKITWNAFRHHTHSDMHAQLQPWLSSHFQHLHSPSPTHHLPFFLLSIVFPVQQMEQQTHRITPGRASFISLLFWLLPFISVKREPTEIGQARSGLHYLLYPSPPSSGLPMLFTPVPSEIRGRAPADISGMSLL